MKETKSKIIVNISGEIFETYDDTLSQFPETLLGDKCRRDLYLCPETQEHFFDRNRLCFPSILHCYQSRGTLYCPKGIPINVFEIECRFFQLLQHSIDRMKHQEGINTLPAQPCQLLLSAPAVPAAPAAPAAPASAWYCIAPPLA